MLRIFRALRSIQGFTVTVYSFVQIIPLMARYFAVLFCVLFSFAVVGMRLPLFFVASVVSRGGNGMDRLCLQGWSCSPADLPKQTLQWWRRPMVSTGTGSTISTPLYVTLPALPRRSCTATLTGCGAPQQSSIMVLFEQLVVNNWPIVMEGCVAATTLWARVYFIFFYGFSVVAVLSVLVRAHGSRLRHPVLTPPLVLASLRSCSRASR